MKPEVSIIIPFFNSENTLHDTVMSVLKQTFTSFEIILVDDGSTDSSVEILTSFNDKRIRIIKQKNGGVVSAYTAGIQNAEGKFITFLDSDDLYDENFLEKAVSDITSKQCDFISYAYTTKDFSSGKTVHKKNGLPSGVYDKARIANEVYPDFIFNTSKKGCYYTLLVFRWNKIYTRELLQKVVPHLNMSLKQMEDNIFTTLAVLYADSFYISDDSYYTYRIDNASISKGYKNDMLEQYCMSFEYLKSILVDKNVPKKEEQLMYMYFDLIRVVYRRAVKSLSFKESRNLLKEMKIHEIMNKISLKKIMALKNRIFYLGIRFRLFGLLYFLFKKA